MKITDIKTFLVSAARPGSWAARNWCFVKVETDEGIVGIGEASGWPRVVETAIKDLTPTLIGEDPGRIERLWQKMLLAIMGHGMTGVVGGGAMTGIEMALWDILGKKLDVPVAQLLGGRCRDRVRVYGHASTIERAQELIERGYTALKAGSHDRPVEVIDTLRRNLGDDIDLCIDVHGPPWFSVPDAIRVGQALEEYDLLFYEDPVPPENLDALAKVASGLSLPLACGERSTTIYGFQELIEREIPDVIQPDMGRAGGFSQMKKIAGMAEAHHIMVAPHDGSNGPVAEAAAVQLLAAIPNCLILEHLADDVPWRYEVATELPVDGGHITVPTRPGLGVELDEAACRRHAAESNVSAPDPATLDAMYVQSRVRRRRLFQIRPRP